MNSSAFSWGVIAPPLHWAGNVGADRRPGASGAVLNRLCSMLSLATWNWLNTTRPHCWPSATPTGVLNVKFWIDGAAPAVLLSV